MNESPAGRDGYIFAMGRRLYHVYKYDFPMEFWYGLTPTDNREDARNVIDVRTLPEKYRKHLVDFEWSKLPKRSMAKTMRQQLRHHALAFANALFDGYSLEDHVERENERAEAEWLERQRQTKAEVANRKAAGLCTTCGEAAPLACGDECEFCDAIPF